MVFFELSARVVCDGCNRHAEEEVPVTEWSSHSWERDWMLGKLRCKGWQVPWEAKKGLRGKVLCPTCAKIDRLERVAGPAAGGPLPLDAPHG